MVLRLIVAVVSMACAAAASCVMWRASNRSGLWSMAAGVVIGLAALVGAVIIAWLLTRAAYPN
jgi:hypothetical protein